jgi:hypothetical protein
MDSSADRRTHGHRKARCRRNRNQRTPSIAVAIASVYQRPFANRLWAARKNRGIGILANEQTDLIGWKPMPLFPAPVEQSKSKGTLVLRITSRRNNQLALAT